ncbi:MAG: GTPase-associated system all-helical protein GASH [Candidatus Acidiferrales bacterium]
MQDNDNELIVLAGAQLIDVIEREERQLADFTALCLVCGAAQNLRQNALVPDIPERAAKYLNKRSENRAEPVKNSPEGKLFDALTAVGAPHSHLAAEFRKLQLGFPLVDEETNMLWWLAGDTSRDLDKRWNELQVGAVCSIGAAELAGLTKVLPGPIAARAFLDCTVRSERKKVPTSISIAEVVGETPKEWREKHHRTPVANELAGLLPIHQAMTLSLQADDDGAWRSVFKNSTKIPSTAKGSPDSVAYQIYLEHLTVRSFAEMDESK